jgi:hypothetical protein
LQEFQVFACERFLETPGKLGNSQRFFERTGILASPIRLVAVWKRFITEAYLPDARALQTLGILAKLSQQVTSSSMIAIGISPHEVGVDDGPNGPSQRCRTLVSNVNDEFSDLREVIVDLGEVGAA